MKPHTLSFLAAFLSSSAAADYIQNVCSPDVTPAPPCQEIINIQSACQANGTDTIDLIAHAECMCGGGFFNNWVGCLDCLYVHGNRSSANVAAFNTIITSASQALCTGTPTANFTDIFANISNSNQPEDVSATGLKDQFPSSTAVSLYFTASGPQGLGAITGSATQATKTAAATAAATTAATTSGSESSSESTSGRSGSSSAKVAGTSSSSSAGAAASQIIGGLLAVVAGGMIVRL